MRKAFFFGESDGGGFLTALRSGSTSLNLEGSWAPFGSLFSFGNFLGFVFGELFVLGHELFGAISKNAIYDVF